MIKTHTHNTLFSLSDHNILIQEWTVVVDQVQPIYYGKLASTVQCVYELYYNQSGVTELLIMRYPHDGCMLNQFPNSGFMLYETNSYHSKHKTLNKCYFKFGPGSGTLAQHLNIIDSTPRICFVMYVDHATIIYVT